MVNALTIFYNKSQMSKMFLNYIQLPWGKTYTTTEQPITISVF